MGKDNKKNTDNTKTKSQSTTLNKEYKFKPNRKTNKEIKSLAKHNIKKEEAIYGDLKLEKMGFDLGTTGGGITLKKDKIIERKEHTFRTKELALNRILTYLAENYLSHLQDGNYPGLAEVQIGWVSGLKCLIITENSIEKFNSRLTTTDDLFEKLLVNNKDGKLKTQGTAEDYIKRMERHNLKLQEVVEYKVPSKRFTDWHNLDPNVDDLVKFLDITNKNCELFTIKKDLALKLDRFKNKIVNYDNAFDFKGTTQHAELYHLKLFKLIAEIYKDSNQSIPEFYVAGTKRACSTCAGEIKAYSENENSILKGHLYADYEHPGNLWPRQIINQTDEGIKNTLENLKHQRMCRTKLKTGSYSTGCNSDSDSDFDSDCKPPKKKAKGN